MAKKFQKIAIGILSVILLTFVALVYRAYVINQPCTHDIKQIEQTNKLKINDKILHRFQKSLSFQTVSFDQNHQNTTAIEEYIQFIRKGFKLKKK